MIIFTIRREKWLFSDVKCAVAHWIFRKVRIYIKADNGVISLDGLISFQLIK